LTLDNIVTLKSGSEVTQDHSNWWYPKVWVRFPIRIVTMALMLYRLRDIASYYSKIAKFLYPTCI